MTTDLERQAKRIQRLEEICLAHESEMNKIPSGMTLDEYLAWAEKNRPPPGPFKPAAFFNADGDQLEAIWNDDSQCFERRGDAMSVGRSQGDDLRTVGAVKVYGLSKLCAESGYMLVPFDTWRAMRNGEDQKIS